MDDLSQWDLAFEFSGHEAACLVRGVDPYMTSTYAPAIQPILNAMRISYEHVLWGHQDEAALDEIGGGWPKEHLDFVFPIPDRKIFARMKDEADEFKFDPKGLYCARISSYYDELASFQNHRMTRENEGIWELDLDRFSRWLRSPNLTAFAAQRFTREEIHRWLTTNGINPRYRFMKEQLAPRDHPVPAEGSAAQGAAGDARIVSFKGRRHPLAPVIEIAAGKCRNPLDVAEIWPHLQALARCQSPPLQGVTIGGVNYIDDMDSPKEFTKRALREYLRRQAR